MQSVATFYQLYHTDLKRGSQTKQNQEALKMYKKAPR